jgi:hypothetical protein
MTNNNTPPPAATLGIWRNLGTWIALGSAFGLLFGTVVGGFFDDATLVVALGLPLGSALGVVAWTVFNALRRNARGES